MNKSATTGGLTLPCLKAMGFFHQWESNDLALRKHLDRMPYGCKSSELCGGSFPHKRRATLYHYLSGGNVSICFIFTELTLMDTLA